jgi:hypothetical protein
MKPQPIRHKSINIEYWIHPDGTDFNGMEQFSYNIDHESLLTINKKRTDALGGGLYDLLATITEDISIIELAKSYAQDGAKVLIGLTLSTFLKEIKDLFKKNKSLAPTLDKLLLDYKDCEVIVYSLYDTSIADAIKEILEKICIFQLRHKKLFKSIKRIHIPIIRHKDFYDLCEFRVKLQVDEPIEKFTKDYYFKYWGISTKKNKFIFDLENDKFIKKKFYTQKAYDKLYAKSHKTKE